MPEVIEAAEPVVKKSLGWKAALAGAYLAGMVTVGGPVVVNTQSEQDAQAYADSVIAAEHRAADSINALNAGYAKVVSVRQDTIPAHVVTKLVRDSAGAVIDTMRIDVPARVVYPGDKFNPLHYYKEGEAIIVEAREELTDSLIYRCRIEAGETSLFVNKPAFVASKPPAPSDVIE